MAGPFGALALAALGVAQGWAQPLAAPAAPAVDPAGEVAGGVASEDAGIQKQAPKPRRSGWVFLPGVTYSPDRGLTFAGGALRYFHSDDDPMSRASSMVLTVEASVSGRGMVSFDPDVWFANERFHVGGTGWVSYLDYAYFGVGNDTTMADREDYTAVRWSLRPEVVMRIRRHLYGGAVYELRYENQTEVDAGGELDSETVRGADGGLVTGIGALVRWDSRDHAFTPRAGGLVSLSPRLYLDELGGDYDFTRLLVEGSWFFSLGGEHVLGVDGQVDLRGGEPPFTYLSGGGGSRLLRGMLEGRYRDMQFAAVQAEYRFPIWWRFGGAAFAGAGRVARKVTGLDLPGLRYSGGAGLRFAIQEDERITVRLDYGRSRDDSGFYLAMLEAF
ncbi:MAG TPA: BamA/TamA family outer membrane protein [Kofleriaceae bacterium]|nr:BamA/TamA family outer membrane protein [Kofleriaceae bacterium]